jgi:hypothetical protein
VRAVPALSPRSFAVALALSVAWALWARVDGAEARAAWQRPVPGALAAAFRFDPSDPYRAGARRVVAFASVRGSAVRAACGGRISFAGRLPGGGGGAGVSVRCGTLVATHLGLTALRVRRGATVRPGAVLGAAAGEAVRLGARRVDDRHGYLDPLTLLSAAPRRRRPFVAPPAAARRHPKLPAAPRTGARGAPALRVPAPSPAGRQVAAPAWLGLVLLALGVPAGGGVALARRRRDQRRPVASTAPARVR